MTFATRRWLAGLLLLLVARAAAAEASPPVAVRWWGHSLVTIETYWNLRVAIDPYILRIGYDDPGLSADLCAITHIHLDHANFKLIGGDPLAVHGADPWGGTLTVDKVLRRPPNAAAPEFTDYDADAEYGEHAIRIRSIATAHDGVDGQEHGVNGMLLFETDGVRILHCGDIGQLSLTEAQLAAVGTVDVMCVPVGGIYTVDGEQAAVLVEQVKPRFVIPLHFKTPELTIELQPLDGFLAALPESYERVRPVGNTLAVARASQTGTGRAKVVLLRSRPWEMPAELAALFAAKDEASLAAGAVLAELSDEQLDHRPSDGSHTPRWNAEHMMGRELGFFTALYTRRDPAVPHLDLNPEQMPPEYRPGHPDWDAAEEARQLERVRLLSRRFAYLLAGADLDERQEGLPWTLRGLFDQMKRHYDHHTANVRKKFELSDWPAREAAPEDATESGAEAEAEAEAEAGAG